MANDFLTDPNCVALFKLDDGALTVDSIGGNTLTNNNTVASDTTNEKEGDGCADFESTSSQSLTIADGDLDLGFPGKSGGTQGTFSVCFWVKFESLAAGRAIVGKHVNTFGHRGWCVIVGASSLICIYKGILAGTAEVYAAYGSAVTTGRWYHVGATFNNDDFSYRIRIWDDTASALLDDDATGNFASAMPMGDATFGLGACRSAFHDGLIDEVAVFKDVLTADEIDLIRQGNYVLGKGAGQFTSLSLMATPGMLHAFSAKTPAGGFVGSPYYYYAQQ